jgi:flagellar hook protein FlgE
VNNLSITATNSNNQTPAPNIFNSGMAFTELQTAQNVGAYDTSISVYDESGQEHVLTIEFVHTGQPGIWEWSASLAGKETIVSGGKGSVTFGQDGTVSSWVFDDGGSSMRVTPNNGSNDMILKLNVGGPGIFTGLTQFAAETTASAQNQDGYPTGNLSQISIDEFGTITGSFSNGTTKKIAQIMAVDFANPGGLVNMSDSVFTISANSGDPVWGVPLASSSSSIKPGSLEMSNVDLATEFTNMITTQRGYQANSRVITVSDSMLEELVSLKR